MTTHNTSDFNTITVPSAAATDNDFDKLDEIGFDESDQAERPITEEARLWWFNGLPTDSDTMAVGWHIKYGINPYIDETCEGMGLQKYFVQHKKPDKDGNTDPKPYWRLRQCNLVVVTQRLQSTLEMNRNVEDRMGLAYAWETVRDEMGNPVLNKRGKEKRQTVLKTRVFVHELYSHGYYNWLPLTLSGFSTDSMLEALGEQYRVLDYYAGLRRAQGKNAVAPFWLFSIPLGPGQVKLVGEPPDQGSIYPITAKIPATLDKDYLKQHLIPRDLIDIIRDGLLSETVLWSMEESVKLASGRNGQGELLALPDGASETAQSGPRSLPSGDENDLQVSAKQLEWIVSQYCGGSDEAVREICSHFKVAEPSQLRVSHFRALVAQVQAANKNAQR